MIRLLLLVTFRPQLGKDSCSGPAREDDLDRAPTLTIFSVAPATIRRAEIQPLESRDAGEKQLSGFQRLRKTFTISVSSGFGQICWLFFRFAAAANLGLSWCRSAPIAGPLMVVGHENQPGMSGPCFIASVHASFGEYPEEFFRACLRPSLAVNKTARGLHLL